MRDRLITIWRKIQKSKKLTGFVSFIMWLVETEVFNATMDFFERLTAREKLKAKREFFIENAERVKENVEVLADDKSKIVYTNAIKYRITLKRKYLSETSPALEKYFDPQIVNFSRSELFVEGGAYIGDTVLSLVEKWPFFNRKTESGSSELNVVCYEPDKYNVAALEKNLKNIKNDHREFCYNIINSAMWNKNMVLQFEGGTDYASKVVDNGKENVKAEKVDDVLQYLYPGKRVSFIKMDIEGAEPEALEGAREMIENYHPTLAVCIYHTDEQMISIIEDIRKKYPFYNIYVRHYARAWTETVMYAIPKE